MWLMGDYHDWEIFARIIITITLGTIIGIFVYQTFLSDNPAVPLITYHRDLDLHNEIHYCDDALGVGFWYINSSNILRMTDEEYVHFCLEQHRHD